jgi:hypothetical protein
VKALNGFGKLNAVKALLVCGLVLCTIQSAKASDDDSFGFGDALGRSLIFGAVAVLAIAGLAVTMAVTHDSDRWLHSGLEELPPIAPGRKITVYRTGGRKDRGVFLEYRNRNEDEYEDALATFYERTNARNRLELREILTIQNAQLQRSPIVGEFFGYANQQIMVLGSDSVIHRIPADHNSTVTTASGKVVDLVGVLSTVPPSRELLAFQSKGGQVLAEIGEIIRIRLGSSSSANEFRSAYKRRPVP